MPLTAAEKVAGRAFRDACQAQLDLAWRTNPAAFAAPHFLGVYRHRCAARAGRSTAIALTEIYQPSPAYEVFATDGTPWLAVQADQPTRPSPAQRPGASFTFVPAARFGFIYRTGRCRGCGLTARSRTGRLVDGRERPPLHRAREQAMSQPQNPGTTTSTPQGESIPGPTYDNPNADNDPDTVEQHDGPERRDDDQ